PDGAARYFVAQFLDITLRKEAELLLAVENRVAALLADEPTPADLFGQLVGILGTGLWWDVVEVWQPDADGAMTRWFSYATPEVAEFHSDPADARMSPGDGLPGTALAHGDVVWLVDLTAPPFVRVIQGRAAGLRTGVGVPVRADDRTAGVILFLSRREVAESPAQCGFFRNLVRAVGRYLEHYAARSRLAESEARFQAFLTNAPFVGWVVSADDRYLYVNAGMSRWLGRPVDEIVGRPEADFFSPDYIAQFQENNRRVLATNEVLTTTETAPQPDGTEGTYLVSKFPLRDPTGEAAIGGVAIDITDRVRAEAALRESEGLLRRVGDNLPDCMVYQYFHTPDGAAGLQYVSAGVAGLYGITPDEAVRDVTRVLERIHPDYHAGLLTAIDVSKRDLSDFTFELPLVSPDGTVRWTRISSRPRRRPDGGTIWDGVQTDITDRKRMEDALRTSEQEARTLAESMPLLVWMADADGAPKWHNRRWHEYTALTADDVSGGRWVSLVHPDDLPGWVAAGTRGRAGAAPYECEIRLRRADGNFRWHLARVVPRPGAADRAAVGWFGTCVDVDEMKEASRAAHAANRAKTEFLASVSHELRTPLGGILGMADLILADPVPGPVREAVGLIRESGLRLKAQVDDLLDLAKVEAGKLDLAAAPFDLRATVRSVLHP
ncbi:MAG: PAS domain S-box protein, partial [Fimbriiglobus sp.]